MKQKVQPTINAKTRKGFTVLEVMLFLAITGLMLIGVMGGTYSAINTQRYNDAVRSFAEFLRSMYSEAISPQSFGEGNSDDIAVLGKVIVFGANNSRTIYRASLVGKADIPTTTGTFFEELKAVMNDKAGLACDTVESYDPLWDSTVYAPSSYGNPMKGVLIIARSPVSGTVHTIFNDTKTYDNIASNCSAASTAIRNDLRSAASSGYKTQVTNFCIKMQGVSVTQDVRLAADGRNASAIQTLGQAEATACH